MISVGITPHCVRRYSINGEFPRTFLFYFVGQPIFSRFTITTISSTSLLLPVSYHQVL